MRKSIRSLVGLATILSCLSGPFASSIQASEIETALGSLLTRFESGKSQWLELISKENESEQLSKLLSEANFKTFPTDLLSLCSEVSSMEEILKLAQLINKHHSQCCRNLN